MEILVIGPTVLGVISSLQSISSGLDDFINRLKTTKRGYSEEICVKLAMMKAILKEVELKVSSKSSHIDEQAVTGHIDAMSKKVKSLNNQVSNDNSLERFWRHGTIDEKLKGLQDMVQLLCMFMQEVHNSSSERQNPNKNHLQIVGGLSLETGMLKQPAIKAGPSLNAYFEQLLMDCGDKIDTVLSNDNFEPVVLTSWDDIKRSQLIGVFYFKSRLNHIQRKGFPYKSSFSSVVPDCLDIVRSFVEHDVGDLHGGVEKDKIYFALLEDYFVKLTTVVLPEALLRSLEERSLCATFVMRFLGNVYKFLDYPRTDVFKQMKQRCHSASYMILDLAKCNCWMKVVNKAEDILNERLFLEMNWKVGLLLIDWTPGKPPQNTKMMFLKNTYDYWKVLTASLKIAVSGNKCHNLMRCLLTKLDNGIVDMFAGEEVALFNGYAVMGFYKDMKTMDAFLNDVEQSLKREWGIQVEPDRTLGSCLKRSMQLVGLLTRIEPQVFPEKSMRLHYYNAMRERYGKDLDSNMVIRVCEKYQCSGKGVGPQLVE